MSKHPGVVDNPSLEQRNRAERPQLAVGAVIDGKYRIESSLKRGGMGAIYVARHVELRQLVAIKVLLYDGDEGAARFAQEAQTCARLGGDHVVRVFDFGRLPDGAPYLVMELLSGRDLSQVIANGPVPVEEAVRYVLEVCDGLREAHLAGVVHRDLKPANLFLAERSHHRSTVKILDFGISKVVAGGTPQEDLRLTTTGVVLGSPAYMSPEQVRGQPIVDVRTDIWSLGVILFELLTGRPPFEGRSISALAVAIVTDPAPRVSTVRAGVGAALDRVIARCLEKDPSARFPSVDALAEALRAVPPHEASDADERMPLASRTTRDDVVWADNAQSRPPGGVRLRTAAIAGVLSAGVLSGALWWASEHQKKGEESRSTNAPSVAVGVATSPSAGVDAGKAASDAPQTSARPPIAASPVYDEGTTAEEGLRQDAGHASVKKKTSPRLKPSDRRQGSQPSGPVAPERSDEPTPSRPRDLLGTPD